ncbi:hypothetical protein [Falsiroseomonas oryzae]|uniref:hypothetical protein n=1 Tax=Falsiroseomonas oryzae TaxID=2766473 RepID=UPI0022EADA9C|nr:hypothetical protein [Roseomonas sp. MO-31]
MARESGGFGERLALLISADPVRALVLATGVCLLRIALFDGPVILAGRGLPNHDILSGIAVFGSAMHALREEGDIAWWLPGLEAGGDALYFNAFLSPISPTPGHPPFLVWGVLVRILAALGLVFPEYRQYLIFTYVLMPIVAYASLALLMRRLCAGWLAPALAVVTYALSGTGIWNNAWMFHQEWACLFLVLWALDRWIAQPSPAHLATLGAACLIYSASASYWTVFSSWFLLAALASHAWLFAARWRRAVRSLLHLLRRRPAAIALAVLVVSAVSLWSTIQGAAYLEQAARHERITGPTGGYRLEDAYARANMNDGRFLLAMMFDPVVERPLTHFMIINPAHNARYTGLVFLPLLAAFFLLPWQRHDHWAFCLAVLPVAAVTTSGLLLLAWKHQPGMSPIQHTFYFYQYFLQVAIIVMGCRAFDRLLALRPPWKGPIRGIPAALAVLGSLGVALIYLRAESLGPGMALTQDPTVKSFGMVTLLLLLLAALLHRIAGWAEAVGRTLWHAASCGRHRRPSPFLLARQRRGPGLYLALPPGGSGRRAAAGGGAGSHGRPLDTTPGRRSLSEPARGQRALASEHLQHCP